MTVCAVFPVKRMCYGFLLGLSRLNCPLPGGANILKETSVEKRLGEDNVLHAVCSGRRPHHSCQPPGPRAWKVPDPLCWTELCAGVSPQAPLPGGQTPRPQHVTFRLPGGAALRAGQAGGTCSAARLGSKVRSRPGSPERCGESLGFLPAPPEYRSFLPVAVSGDVAGWGQMLLRDETRG